jgi:chorismate mutase
LRLTGRSRTIWPTFENGAVGSLAMRKVTVTEGSATEGSAGRGPMDALRTLRHSIDNIDAAVIYMLAERFRCTKAVGVLKAEHGLPPADPAREEEQIARLRGLAKAADLDPDFAEKFLNFVIREVIRHHEAARQR